eukprot:CAMPEP_0197072180 /NCGR_PEP_ID=MMETSP1384-20130603/209966_1 /TAXON_ID=29189 /ORGANISM="Ammonia sp." /LENGTH=447 /DNA_ID=CAMNT_0042510995 /DNA_START=82 /DNA_END=1425 /DNA_ORIENTATION=-
MNHVQAGFGSLFLSRSARNKKFENRYSRKKAFDFFEIHQALQSKSFVDFLESEASPYILICVVLCAIVLLYVVIAVISSLFVFSSAVDSEATVSAPAINATLNIEIGENVEKLFELKRSGSMKEYEAFILPVMQKFCLQHLDANFLDTQALESFHMNLAEMVAFVARGSKFTDHKTLKVTYLGGIIDPANSEEPAAVKNSAKSCPLLDAVYKAGSTDSVAGTPNTGDADGKNSSVDSSDKFDNPANSEEPSAVKNSAKSCPLLDAVYKAGSTDSVAGTPNTGDADGKNSSVDSSDKFDKKYSWKNMKELFELILRDMSSSQKCIKAAREVPKEGIKQLFMSFYEMADVIGKATAKLPPSAELYYFVPDRKSPDYKKYMIGKDGGIYEVEKYEDHDELYECEKLEYTLNDKFVLDENLSYTNVKIALDDGFDNWYDTGLLPKVEEGKA